MLFAKSDHSRLELNLNATHALYNISWLVLCVLRMYVNPD